MAGKSSVIDVKILGDNKGLSTALGSAEKRIGKFAKAAALGFAAVGVGAAVGLAKIGSSFDKEYDKIRTGTGATGKALEGLEDSFKNVLKDVPASFGEAGTAIADLNTRLGLTGKPLEDLSGQFLNLARITKTDVKTDIDDITRVFGDWEVATGDQARALDELYRASQSSGIGLNDLSSSVVQFGAPLRNLGFGFDESLALLAQFNKTGVNTETVFAGLKQGVGKLAKEGEAVPETFRRVVDEITKLGPGTEATGLAIELFGQRSGPDLADAITGGKFAIDDMLAAITDGTDTINDAAKDTESFGEKWTRIKNRVLVALEPLATKVFEAIGDAMDKLGPYVEDFVGWFSEEAPKALKKIRDAWKRWGQPVFDEIVDAARSTVDWIVTNWPKLQDAIQGVFQWMRDNKEIVLSALVGIGVAAATAFGVWAVTAAAAAVATLAAAAPFIALGAAIAAVAGAFVYAYNNVGWFRDAVDAVVVFFRDTVWPILQTTWEIIRTVVTSIVNFIRDNWDTISTIITTVFGYVRDYVQIVWDFISGYVESAIKIIRGVIKTVTSLIKGDWSGVWDGIKQILSGVWDGMKSTVKAAIDYVKLVIKLGIAAIKLAWNTVWRGIKDFVRDRWDDITDFVSNGVDDIVSFVTGLPGRVASAVTGAFDGIWTAFKGVLNKIIGAWNRLGFTLPKVSVDWNGPFPGGKVDVGGWTINTPTLPYVYHSGGVVPGPPGSESLALLEAGERVIPANGATGPITLIIEGRPFSAMIAEHEDAQVAQLLAGAR